MPAEAGISFCITHEIPAYAGMAVSLGMIAEVARMTEREHEIPAYAGMTAEMAGMFMAFFGNDGKDAEMTGDK
jgi:hypothetical protein